MQVLVSVVRVTLLPQPVVAKVLTILSSLGLVADTRGPSGGDWLKRPPEAISLLDIVEEFERSDAQSMCPFGPNWCGHGDPCPMHDSLLRMGQQWMAYLRETSLSVFPRKRRQKLVRLRVSANGEFDAGEYQYHSERRAQLSTTGFNAAPVCAKPASRDNSEQQPRQSGR